MTKVLDELELPEAVFSEIMVSEEIKSKASRAIAVSARGRLAKWILSLTSRLARLRMLIQGVFHRLRL
jgi:hypothetical protein